MLVTLLKVEGRWCTESTDISLWESTQPLSFAVGNNFYFCLCSAEIPEWLVVYTKAPAEHDHKLKVGVRLICWGKHSYSLSQLGSGSVTCRQYTYSLSLLGSVSYSISLPRSDSSNLHTCPSASLCWFPRSCHSWYVIWAMATWSSKLFRQSA